MKIPQNYEEALRQLIQMERTLSVDERRRIITKAKRLAEGFYLLSGKGVEK